MKILYLSVLFVGALGLVRAQTVQNVTYGSGTNTTVSSPAQSTVTAGPNVTVASGATVVFQATNTIVLGSGFTAVAGSSFHAKIVGGSTTYSLSVVNGSGSGSGFSSGAVVNISANAPPSGQTFTGWQVSGPGTIGNANASSTTFTVGAGNATVTATYSGGANYTLTVENGAGDASNLSVGSVQNITADPPPSGQTFANWVLIVGPGTIGNATSSSTTFTMGSGSATVRATYNVPDPNGDNDGDGISNGIEAQLGTNPGSQATSDTSNQTQLKIHRPQN